MFVAQSCERCKQTYGAELGMTCSQCGMMPYSETLVADCDYTRMNEAQSSGKGSNTETGTWITYDSKQSILEITDNTSANNLDIIFVSTLTVRDAKAKNQDK